ncbi:2-amino-4-oxopentanoate thiolase subunit OrtB [Sporomusa sp.]|uniref:2-amino-4-oxopentanoate thiolase subunit OrtB n=1 Tax=Sporomusa sp. TaxID=2078658 RepID=UPI002C6380C8|nr:2-amino-4-oxopentanoate thiolase subunit OrtB [Sporomusa sp.]HWR42736.1 2-amino-4-oxopentanoate thiolase subunit OrtB [Sporomusa sp.]
MRDTSYQAVMARRPEIIRRATNIDYREFESGGIAFDYEKMMRQAAYDVGEIAAIQRDTGVGDTPLIELKNITALVRQIAAPGKGARIFLKDEAVNPSGSFKARRAAVSVYHACKHGYPGVIAATSGNFGAAIASQAAMRNLRSIIVQEVFDSRGIGQPEIMEKGRACEAYGAEVLQLSVGPELFYMFLLALEETGFFNASLYTPFSIAGIETLGVEVAAQTKKITGRYPDAVVVTHAGGGNVTGTARGLKRAGCGEAKVIAASVDLSGLHMASDTDFNRKSFTTGHTGFGVPFATNPDRVDVPRNAARSLRYLDRYVTVTQGEVFYVTEMLAALEGLERGPAGNTSLAAAIALAKQMDQEEVIVVQETEYTGAGKHPSPQLTFAKANGIAVRRGLPADNVPGQAIVIPEHPGQIAAKDIDLDKMRYSYMRNVLAGCQNKRLSVEDIEFLAQEIRLSPANVEEMTNLIMSGR